MGVVSTNQPVAGPTTFSVEAWVKSGSNTGGRILGFGNGSGMNPSSTTDRQLYLAPNGKVFGELIVNFTHHAERRVDLIFRIDFHDDLAKALETLQRVGSAHRLVLSEPAVLAEAMTLSESWAEVALRAWVKSDDYGEARSELLVAAKRALADEGFLVPYPHQVAIQRAEP